MNDQLIIIGAGGHGKVVADIADQMNVWEKISFLDEKIDLENINKFDVLGKTADILNYKDTADVFIAIGDNLTREKISKKLIKDNFSLATLIHPKAIVDRNTKIGLGSVIMAGVVINSSTKIGKGCIINTSSSLDHDNLIEDYVHISPGAHLAGSVHIGQRSWLGISSAVINNIQITKDCVIAAGSVVIKNIKVSGTYVGVPAKKIK